MSFSPAMNTRHTADVTCRYGGHAINEGLWACSYTNPAGADPPLVGTWVYDRRRCHSRDCATQPVSSWLRIFSNLIM